MSLRRREAAKLSRCKEECTKTKREISLKRITLSKPELAKDKPPNSCRYKNCKRCQEETSKEALFPADCENDCSLTNNNETTANTLEDDTFDSHSIKAEPSNSTTSDMSMYDYTDESDQSPGDESTADGDRRCTLCKVVVKDQIELLRHQREFHKFPKTILTFEQIERYFDYPNRNNCPICKKPIRSNFRSVFIKHLKTHTMGKSAVCRICKMVFKSKSYMKSHEKRHVVQD